MMERVELIEKEFDEKLAVVRDNFKLKLDVVEGELAVAKNCTSLPKDELKKHTASTRRAVTNLERECYRNAQYSQYETLEV